LRIHDQTFVRALIDDLCFGYARAGPYRNRRFVAPAGSVTGGSHSFKTGEIMTRKIPLPIELLQDSEHLFDAINSEPILPCVLLVGAHLEQALAKLLKAFFIEGSTTVKSIFDDGNVLNTVRSRADVAYCLGLISKVNYANTCLIGEIRHIFAHSDMAIDFTNPDVLKRCDRLESPVLLSPSAASSFLELMKNTRTRFSIISVMLINKIIVDAASLKRRPKYGEAIIPVSQADQVHQE
jgi:DNA-binding MltR family transcriptional regulator